MDRRISREYFLKRAASLALGGSLACALPHRRLEAAGEIYSLRLPSQERLWDWVRQLNGFGVRLTGTEAHAASIDFLGERLAELGLEVLEDNLYFDRWSADHASLCLDDGSSIRVASIYPYSGLTQAEGVCDELVWFEGEPGSYAAAKGKIAVVALERCDATAGLVAAALDRKDRLPDHLADYDLPRRTPLITGMKGVKLAAARSQGVKAVVCVMKGVSDGQLEGQVFPFLTPYQELPAVWLTEREGLRLRDAASNRRRARLVLRGEFRKNSPSKTLYACLEGSDPKETIIVNTHTDGPNACEENGAAGVLALARHFASLPRAARRRSFVFVLATGHFQPKQFALHCRQATWRWLSDHREFWDGRGQHRKAVAGLTIEHLGCREWEDHPDSCPKETGRLEPDLIYTANESLNRVYRRAAAGRSKLRAVTASPRFASFMLGEGQPLYQAGIPVISSCALPDYLCQKLPDGGLDRLDPAYAYQQVVSFARAAAMIDALPSHAIGQVPYGWDIPVCAIMEDRI